jgi:uncharacterized membrane protein YkoI
MVSFPAMTRKAFLATLLAFFALALPVLPVEAQGACLSDREIQSAISSGKILPLNKIITRAGLTGKVLSFKVCENGGQLQFVISIDEGSRVRKVYVNAKTGRP